MWRIHFEPSRRDSVWQHLIEVRARQTFCLWELEEMMIRAMIEGVKKINPLLPPRPLSSESDMKGTTTFQTVENKNWNMNPTDQGLAHRWIEETSPTAL